MFFKKLKSRHKTAYKKRGFMRGFTLAETVIALAVISIASVSTLSLILASHRATTSAAQKQQAQLFAADIVNCFRVSDTYGDFEENVKFAFGKGISENTIPLDDELTANVTISDNKTITVTVKNDQKDLAEMEFTKGVALNEETP